MRKIDPRLKLAILRALRDAPGPVGSGALADLLGEMGFHAHPRTLRLYLQELEQNGLVTPAGRGRAGGRKITELGLREIDRDWVTERVGLLATRVNGLIHRMTFDPHNLRGTVIINVSLVREKDLPRAVRVMAGMYEGNLGIGEYLTLFSPGTYVGDVRVPPGHVGLGTLCSMTLNGLLLSRRIPVDSKFAGVLEIREGEPFRFTDVIYYNGTSLDPLTIFIKSDLLSVGAVLSQKSGCIAASFREIPACARPAAEAVFAVCREERLGYPYVVGRPGQRLLNITVTDGCIGLAFVGGLNAMALVEEAGIPTRNHGTVCLFPFENLRHYTEVLRDLGR